jgi:hypothetical protein
MTATAMVASLPILPLPIVNMAGLSLVPKSLSKPQTTASPPAPARDAER